MTAEERLEALAKAAYNETRPAGSRFWQEESQGGRDRYVRFAGAVLTFLGFDPENPPEQGAGAKAAVALRAFCDPKDWLCASKETPAWHCPWCGGGSGDGEGHDIFHLEGQCPVALGQDGLRALAGDVRAGTCVAASGSDPGEGGP